MRMIAGGCGTPAFLPSVKVDARRGGAGFAMIEILVTLLILLLGLLGMAGLMTRSNTAEMESYQRVQALVLLQDMANRINANRVVASCYSNGTTGMQLGTASTATPTCTLGNAEQNAQAVNDMTAWNSLLLGSAEVTTPSGTSPGSNVGAMIGARGCITLIDSTNNIYMISVVWQGLTPTYAPVDACGKGQYGDDRLRREVTSTVRIGVLT